jgi:hypothetical protein
MTHTNNQRILFLPGPISHRLLNTRLKPNGWHFGADFMRPASSGSSERKV